MDRKNISIFNSENQKNKHTHENFLHPAPRIVNGAMH